MGPVVSMPTATWLRRQGKASNISWQNRTEPAPSLKSFAQFCTKPDRACPLKAPHGREAGASPAHPQRRRTGRRRHETCSYDLRTHPGAIRTPRPADRVAIGSTGVRRGTRVMTKAGTQASDGSRSRLSPRVRMRCLPARTGSVLAPGSIERARPALFGLWGGAADGHLAALAHTGKPDEVGNRPQRLPLSTERGRRGRVCRLLRQGGCPSPQAAQQVGAEVSGGRERAVDRTNRTSVRGDPRRSRHRRPSASARPNVNGIDA